MSNTHLTIDLRGHQQQRIINLVDAALHNLQADGTVDRGGIANLLREMRDQLIVTTDPMTRCLGFAFDMKAIRSWPIWLCDYSVVQEAIDKGWIVELHKEPFIPRLGRSFIISGLSDEGKAEFMRRLPTLTSATPQPKEALSIKETEHLLGSEPSYPVKVSDYVSHHQTDDCEFDRNASHTHDTYVCTCGWQAAPRDQYKD